MRQSQKHDFHTTMTVDSYRTLQEKYYFISKDIYLQLLNLERDSQRFKSFLTFQCL